MNEVLNEFIESYHKSLNKKELSLKNKIFGGVAWNAFGLIIDNGLNLLVKLILARLLMPEAFGIIGLSAVFIGMVQVFSDLGMSAALIQRKEDNLDPVDLDTAYWAGIAWGILLMVLLSLLVAPIGANFYNEPLLTSIIPVLSLPLIFRPLQVIHIVKITRELNFKKIVVPRNSANVLAAIVSITMALTGFGVWSLVFQSVSSQFFLVFIYSYISPWRPKMRFSKESFKNIFSFGIYTSGTSLFNYLTGNIDYLFIGKILGAQPLGLYTLGYNITYVIRGQIMRVINNVFYPVYSKVQDDLETVKRYYLKVIRYNCVVIYPIMVGLILMAEPFVIYGLGEKWRGAIVPMQFMAAAGLVHLLTSSNTVLLRGLGKPKLEMIFSIIKTLGINVPFIIAGVYIYGIVGAAAGLLAAKSTIFFVNNYILWKVAKIKSSEIILNSGSLFGISAIASLLTLVTDNYFILGGILIIYLAAHFLISFKDLKQIIEMYKKRKKR